MARGVVAGDATLFTDESFDNASVHNDMCYHPSGAPHAQHAPTGNMVALAEHIHEGLYTDKETRPGASNVKGGSFVLDVDTGVCGSAKKTFEHGFRSLDKHNQGMQAIINADPELGGTFPSVTCSVAVRERALKSHL